MRVRSVCSVLVLLAATPAGAQSHGPPGAAACSGCHPPHAGTETVLPPLNGRREADTIAAMQGFRSGQLPATVMDRIAKGFSDDEIRAIAAYFSKLF